MVKKLCVVFAFAFSLFAQNAVTLDEAIAEAMRYLSNRLVDGTRVHLENFEADSESLSSYIVEESSKYLFNNSSLSPVGRENAQTVVSGSISQLGENFRFRIQAADVSDGEVQGMLSLTVKKDDVLTGLLATRDVRSAEVRDDVLKTESPNLFVRGTGTFNVILNGEFVARNSAQTQELSVPNGKHEIVIYRSGGGNTASKVVTVTEGVSYYLTMRGMIIIPYPYIIILPPKIRVKSSECALLLGINFQRFYDFYPSDNIGLFRYDSHVVRPESFNLEIGKINGIRRGRTITGIANYGPGNVGGGIFLGRTALKSDIFKFRGGIDLGYWHIKTQALEEGVSSSVARISYGRVRVNHMLGGPHVNFLVGYDPFFASLGLKALFGFGDEYDMANYHDSGSRGRMVGAGRAMFSWNLGLTFTL